MSVAHGLPRVSLGVQEKLALTRSPWEGGLADLCTRSIRRLSTNQEAQNGGRSVKNVLDGGAIGSS
jgi:hypothetical protein